MEIKTIDAKQTVVTLADQVFASEFNESLIHQVVTAYMAQGRAGTKAQKTRSEVSGGGVKPWRQKGTGRARAGTIRSPLWRKGGKVFAAEPRDYTQKVNKKMYRIALRSMLSELIRTDRLSVVSDIEIKQPKTKLLLKQLQDWQCEKFVLILTDVTNHNLFLSARNLPHVALHPVKTVAINPVLLMKAEKVVATAAAMKVLEDALQ